MLCIEKLPESGDWIYVAFWVPVESSKQARKLHGGKIGLACKQFASCKHSFLPADFSCMVSSGTSTFSRLAGWNMGDRIPHPGHTSSDISHICKISTELQYELSGTTAESVVAGMITEQQRHLLHLHHVCLQGWHTSMDRQSDSFQYFKCGRGLCSYTANGNIFLFLYATVDVTVDLLNSFTPLDTSQVS